MTARPSVSAISDRPGPLVAVTPIARPGAPTITAITPGDSYLSVAFTAGSAGGDPITSYQYSLNGGTTWTSVTGMTSPLVIDGLTDGTSYTVILRAVSAAGRPVPLVFGGLIEGGQDDVQGGWRTHRAECRDGGFATYRGTV